MSVDMGFGWLREEFVESIRSLFAAKETKEAMKNLISFEPSFFFLLYIS